MSRPEAPTRVAEAVAAAGDEGRAALVVYLPSGYPDVATSERCLAAAAEAGADVLEIGFPYSDPLMDGPVIQAACQTALEGGWTPREGFASAARLTDGLGVPAVVMTYLNLVWSYRGGRGEEAFAADAAAAGLAGAILPDLPATAGGGWCEAAAAAGLATVFLAAPTSSRERLRAVAERSTGFVYATSTLGVTGERAEVGPGAAELVGRLREVTAKPVCVGIGVRSPAQAAEVASFADGVIVGSAAVRAAGEGGPERVGELVAELREGCRRRADAG